MNNKRIIIGVTIGIIAAILWSVVFINVLNSMAGIGIGICLGISFAYLLVYLAVLFFQKKIKIYENVIFLALVHLILSFPQWMEWHCGKMISVMRDFC